jgi:hypothetical protein
MRLIWFQTGQSFVLLPANRDRKGPHGLLPPTPPGIRITYQGGSVDCSGLCETSRVFGYFGSPHNLLAINGKRPHLSAGLMRTDPNAYLLSHTVQAFRGGITSIFVRLGRDFPTPALSITGRVPSSSMLPKFDACFNPPNMPSADFSYAVRIDCSILSPAECETHRRPPGVRHRAFRA